MQLEDLSKDELIGMIAKQDEFLREERHINVLLLTQVEQLRKEALLQGIADFGQEQDAQPVQQPAPVALSDDREAFEKFWTNPYHGDNSSIEWNEGDGYFSFLTREAYRAWQAGRADLIEKSGADIRHDKLFQVYSETLTTLGYTSIEADSNGLMAVANYAILSHAAPVAAPVAMPAASVQPGNGLWMALDEVGFEIFPAGGGAQIGRTLSMADAERIVDAHNALLRSQPDSGRDAALVEIASQLETGAGGSQLDMRRLLVDSARRLSALAANPANVAQPVSDSDLPKCQCFTDLQEDYCIYRRKCQGRAVAYSVDSLANVAQAGKLSDGEIADVYRDTFNYSDDMNMQGSQLRFAHAILAATKKG